ncbi:AI-2E family transporter [Patescibacteria group bacterium]|nr:AI-2E family transporter [Patescibacteria group bacterium]
MSENHQSHLIRVFASLVIASLLTYCLYLLLKPFILPVLVGGILTLLSRPIYLLFYQLSRSATLAAFLTVISILMLVLGPLALLATVLIGEIGIVRSGISTAPHALSIANTLLNQGVHKLNLGIGQINLHDLILTVLSYIGSKSSWVVGSVFGTIGTIFLAMVTTFYLLQCHEQIRPIVRKFSPLSRSDTDLIMTRAKEVVWAAVSGNLVLISLEGVTAMLGFYIFGLSAPVLLGVLYGISSLIPTIGASLVWIPVVIYEFLAGNFFAGIGIVAWVLCQAILYDNYLGPHLIQRRAHLHPFLILLGILGGVAQFGVAGIILGPTLVALGIVGLEIWHHAWLPHEE